MALPEDHIRLISISPGNDEDHNFLSREHIQSLQFAPDSQPYIALSYTWGKTFTNLECDGIVYTVSTNLPPALQSLYRCFPGRAIWTDILSINQQDGAEKQYQVSIMGRIFSQAEAVAVWLGPDTGAVYDQLLLLADTAKNDAEASKQRCRALTEIATCPWFYRAWTFQEIRLASNAVALFGNRYVPWSEFIAALMKVRRLEPHLSTSAVRSTPRSDSKFRPVTQDRFFAMIEELSGTSNDLADLLYLTWYRDASEKRDKVYALLGAELLTTDHGISIDYGIDWSTLCKQSVRAALNTAQNLKVLKFAGMTRRWRSPMTNRWDPAELSRLLEHPSWAPDWWTPPQDARSPASFRFAQRGVFSALDFCCSPRPPKQDMSNTSSLLVLSGVLLGLINTDQDPTYSGGPTLVHPPPHCASLNQDLLVSPADSEIAVPAVYTQPFIAAVDKHLQGDCLCFPPLPRAPNSRFPGPVQPPKLKFGNDNFTIHYCTTPPHAGEDEVPAQVLAESVESGDWLVLLEGGSDPLVIRPVKDRGGRIVRPQEFSSPQDELSGEEGLFLLVGEASMCWDELWPRRWSSYCRNCSFVLV